MKNRLARVVIYVNLITLNSYILLTQLAIFIGSKVHSPWDSTISRSDFSENRPKEDLFNLYIFKLFADSFWLET